MPALRRFLKFKKEMCFQQLNYYAVVLNLDFLHEVHEVLTRRSTKLNKIIFVNLRVFSVYFVKCSKNKSEIARKFPLNLSK
jgi:hypothetical protein